MVADIHQSQYHSSHVLGQGRNQDFLGEGALGILWEDTAVAWLKPGASGPSENWGDRTKTGGPDQNWGTCVPRPHSWLRPCTRLAKLADT